jgi:hypothetical protein
MAASPTCKAEKGIYSRRGTIMDVVAEVQSKQVYEEGQYSQYYWLTKRMKYSQNEEVCSETTN